MLRVGIVGSGGMPDNVHIPILRYMDDCEIAYVSDIDGEQATKLGRQYSVPAVEIESASDLPACGIAVLSVPVGAREDYVLEFADRDVPLFCDKPFAVDLETHDKFVNESETIGCNFQRQFYNNVSQMGKIIKSRTFGGVHAVYFTETHPGSTGIGEESYMLDSELSGGGILMEKGCHSFSQIDALFPEATIRIADAVVNIIKGFDTAVQATLKIETDSADFELEDHLSNDRELSTKVEVEFEYNTIRFDPTEPGEPLQLHSNNCDQSICIQPTKETPTSYLQAMYKSWITFLNAVRNDEIMSKESHTSRTTTRLIDEIYQTTQQETVE